MLYNQMFTAMRSVGGFIDFVKGSSAPVTR